MAHSSRQAQRADLASHTADRLHSAAIHLLRRLRTADTASGLSGPRLSALSVIVFSGPVSLTQLAAAEQVRPPTMTRMVADLERLGLVERLAHPTDRRALRIQATAEGRKLLQEGRRRRVAHLAEAIGKLPARDRDMLLRAAEMLDRIALAPR
jgi:DNA-binding MarR family transcriptional regulator